MEAARQQVLVLLIGRQIYSFNGYGIWKALVIQWTISKRN
jgi:hypothetical protein